MAGMSITDERQETISFSDHYYPPEESRFAANAGGEYDFDDLEGLKLGAQGATIQAAYIEETYGDDNSILTFESPDQSVADLAAGNIDVLFADSSFLNPVVEGSSGAIEFVGPEVPLGGGVGMGLRKDDTELLETMATALDALKKDGTVDALIKEYFKDGPFYETAE